MICRPVSFDLSRFGGVHTLRVSDDDSASPPPPNGRKTALLVPSVPGVPRDTGIVNAITEGRKNCVEINNRTTGDIGDNRGQTAPGIPDDPDSAIKPTPRFRITAGELFFGDVCAGWTPAGWAVELRRKADRCDEYRPDIADYFRRWAGDIEGRLGIAPG